MADVKTWSETASGNNAAAPDGAPEGHARKDVNNIQREAMAALSRAYGEPAWTDQLKRGAGFTLTRISDTVLSLAHNSTPTDARQYFPVGARIQVTDSADPDGRLQGFVTARSFVTPDTSVTVNLDGAAVLQAGVDTIECHVSTEMDSDTKQAATLGTAAWVATGTGAGEIPTMDDLGDQVLLDGGAGGGTDADLLDGQHGSNYEGLSAASRKNLLVNASMSIWQRGTTINTSTTYLNDNGAYIADQWVLLMGDGVTRPAGGSGVIDASRVETNGAKVPYAMRLQGNANVGATAEKIGAFQLIEAVRTRVSDATISVSVAAKHSVASGMGVLQMAIVEWQGGADGPSSMDPINNWQAVGVEPTTITNYVITSSTIGSGLTLTTNWQTLTLENVTRTASCDNLGVLIWVDDQSWVNGDSVDIASPNLVNGATASSQLAPTNMVADYLDCARYFETTFPPGTAPAQNTGLIDDALIAYSNRDYDRAGFQWDYRVPKFKTPTIVTYNPNAADADAHNIDDGAVNDAAIDGARTQNGVQRLWMSTVSQGSTRADRMAIHVTSEAVL